jgi:hypothetical protein
VSLALQLAVALVATVGALGGVVWSGVTHRRAAHYRFVGLFVALLAVAIWRAEAFGRGLVFEGAAAVVRRVHMGAVAATFLALPFVAWTGIRLARGTPPLHRGNSRADGSPVGAGDARRAHHRSAEIFVALVLITSALGTAMTLLATRP